MCARQPVVEIVRSSAAVGAKRPDIPRRLDFRTLTQADLGAIALELNDRPRQTLGFKTPSQALAEVLR